MRIGKKREGKEVGEICAKILQKLSRSTKRQTNGDKASGARFVVIVVMFRARLASLLRQTKLEWAQISLHGAATCRR